MSLPPKKRLRALVVYGLALAAAAFVVLMILQGGTIQTTELNESEANFITECNNNGGTAYSDFRKEPAVVEFCEYENGTRVNYSHSHR